MGFVKERLERLRASNGMAMAIVYATLMLDNMLLTAVVPVLPEYFFRQHLAEAPSNMSSLRHDPNTTETPPIPSTTSSTANVTIEPDSDCNMNQELAFLSDENLYIGILFASKPIVQIVANAAVGPISDYIGFDVPMFTGYVIMCFSAVLFAFGKNYSMLLVARAIQGIGSACASTAGMGMLADRYSDEEKRGRALGIALGGLAMGILIGPVFGSVVYELAGKEWVFLVLAIMALFLAVTQLSIYRLNVERRQPGEEGTSLATLLRDPYIVICACAIMLGNMCIGVLETGQPIWMMINMCAPKWALGVAFLPESVSYMLMTYVVALLCQSYPRWLICVIGLYFITAGCVGLPFATKLPELIVPGLVIGSAVGLVDTSMFPVMATLVDQRHKPVYGSVYAIADVAFCVAFIVGPLCAGLVVSTIGFEWLMWIVAMVTFLFTPLVFFLRKPTSQSEEKIPILYHAKNSDCENGDDVFHEAKNGSMVHSD
ncbi:synaptic vesicular amine transporter-like [Clavelina lepadiformis]|uniref:synaptic vesicular amine transporter-like n=1 Tax=Clavelina lepadiformis TaxID=159417 RepID=UPI004043674E